MLISLLQSEDKVSAFITILMMIPVILFSLSIHEFSHGYIAYKCGDKTAKMFGRLTLNPIKHLDPIGALMMLFIGFGWAKPVPVNMRNLKKPKRDMVFVSLAGPVSNFIVAFIAVLLEVALAKFVPIPNSELGYKLFVVLFNLFYLMYFLNLGLAVFNLIPIPPLDGSKILAGLLPNQLAYKYLQLEKYLRYFFFILIIASYIPISVWGFHDLGDLILYPVTQLRELISQGMFWLAEKIFFFA